MKVSFRVMAWIVPNMTYNVFGGTLNPTLRLDLYSFQYDFSFLF